MTKNLPKLPFGSMAFSVVVDYAQSKEQMFGDAGFSVLFDIPDVPISGQGKVTRLLYLVPFFKPGFKTEEALALLKKLGLKPGKAEDLLALLRDRKETLNRRGVTRLVEFGTIWNEFRNIHSASDHLLKGNILMPWPNDSFYILALAEDGIRRKVHKTPRINPPYAQPKPWFKLPEVKPKTKGKQNREQAKARILEKVPKALFFEIEVDYTQTAAEMVKASGFGYHKKDGSLGDSSVIPVTMGKPAGKPSKVKKEIVLIPLSSLPEIGFLEGVEQTTAVSFMEKLSLFPAFAEDLLALLKATEGEPEMSGIKGGRLVAFGTRWQGNFTIKETLRTVNGSLFSYTSSGLYAKDHWALARFN